MNENQARVMAYRKCYPQDKHTDSEILEKELQEDKDDEEFFKWWNNKEVVEFYEFPISDQVVAKVAWFASRRLLRAEGK